MSASYDPKAWLWFLSSYAPLWLMLGLRFDPLWLSGVLISVSLLCGGVVGFLVTRSAAERPSSTTLTVVGDGGSEVSGYIASYLLPFLTIGDPGAREFAMYGVFLLVAGLVYVRSGLMQVNPTIYMFNRGVKRATIAARGGGTAEVFVITRRNLRAGDRVHAERFSDRVYIHHEGRQ